MSPIAREIWGYNYDHKTTVFTTDLIVFSMHTVLNPCPCLPLSATTYFIKVRDTRRLRYHPYTRGFRVMLEVWTPWLLEVILKPRSCGLSASLWAVSISLVVIPLWKPKNRVMAHYMMESWTSPQNVTPTLLWLDLITTAMHHCLCLTPELDFPLFLHSSFNSVLKALESSSSRVTFYDFRKSVWSWYGKGMLPPNDPSKSLNVDT